MDQPESILCPRCKNLISSYLAECSHCGLPEPLKKHQRSNFLAPQSLVKPLIWFQGGLFGLSFALSFVLEGRVNLGHGFFSLPAPSSQALAALGWATTQDLFTFNPFPLITATFLHGGILHLIFNMLWLRDLGRLAEEAFGKGRLLWLLILTWLMGNLVATAQPLFWLALGISAGPTAVLGASGAVFGLMGAIMAYGKRMPRLEAKMISKQMGKWALILIIIGLIIPQVSNAAHIGGFIAGWLYGRFTPLAPKGEHPLLTGSALALIALAFVQVWLRFI